MSKPKVRSKRRPMVRWYDPGQLSKTAVDVLLSTIFGRHADHRLVEAMAMQDKGHTFHPYPKGDAAPPDEFWIDYVADVGDGWNSTFTVASAIAEKSLELTAPNGEVHTTQRGSVLVFGGDEVYPTASRRAYEERLIEPYKTAMPHGQGRVDVFAIPGNHDWYDSLVSFTRLFMSGKAFGGWQPRQERSYFALRLPHDWWLLGIDVQLGASIDVLQLEYFEKIASAHIKPDHGVIICTAEPEWIWEKMYDDPNKGDDVYTERTIDDFQMAIFGGRKHRAQVIIAGDLHHYRRHVRTGGGQGAEHKITAGGGGAFLHPTHRVDVDKIGRTSGMYELAKDAVTGLPAVYPDVKTSSRLCWRNLAFAWHNPSFMWLSGGIYLLIAMALRVPLPSASLNAWDWSAAFGITFWQLVNSPSASFFLVALIAGFLIFTDTHKRWYRLCAGAAHSTAHLIAVFFIAWSATFLALEVQAPRSGGWMFLYYYVWPAVATALGGALVGSTIFGSYLLLSLNCFGRHSNEAFSALRIEDWKNFIRMKISKDGLTIFPVGIDKVKKWKLDEEQPILKSNDHTPPRLIEKPIHVSRPRVPDHGGSV